MWRAASRPSAIAQTTIDWPRRQSPAAKMPRLGGHVVAVAAEHAALGERQVEGLGQDRLGSGEADRQQHQLAGEDQLGAVDLLELAFAHLVEVLLDADGVQLLDVAAVVADELLGLDLPVALAPFFVRGGEAEDLGPERPGGLRVLVLGRARVVVELEDRAGLLAVAGAQAVGGGVAAADDDHVLAGGQDRVAVERGAEAAAVLLGQERHRQLDPLQAAAGDVQVARPGGADREQHRVVPRADIGRVDRPADLGVAEEPHPLGLELLDAALDVDAWPS